MPCYSPLQGFKSTLTTKTGKRKLTFGSAGYRDLPVTVACGQCIGCRLERSRQWAVRLMHERQMHDLAIFVTLTYSDEYLPANGSLDVTHFQSFMKRLRKHHAPAKIRFFHSGEYGETTRRPHYHAILFGIDFADKKKHSKSPTGDQQYISETLDKIWGLGMCMIGSVTFESCGYVARYVTKKVTGDQASSHYQALDLASGEIHQLQPEYCTMSRRPGIGATWFDKFQSDVFPRDRVVIRGKEASPPRFYLKRLAGEDPAAETKIKRTRIRQASKHKADQTPERLRARLICRQAKIQSLKRTL